LNGREQGNTYHSSRGGLNGREYRFHFKIETAEEDEKANQSVGVSGGAMAYLGS
jgi:hypothetical protein